MCINWAAAHPLLPQENLQSEESAFWSFASLTEYGQVSVFPPMAWMLLVQSCIHDADGNFASGNGISPLYSPVREKATKRTL